MKFSPTYIHPKQNRALTPDVFIVDEYGKVVDQRKDGQLVVNQEVRMSRIIDKLNPAFVSKNDTLIYGCYIEKSTIRLNENGDLLFTITPGMGIIDSRVFKIDANLECKWPGFVGSVPSYLSHGKIVLYFYFKDEVQNLLKKTGQSNFQQEAEKFKNTKNRPYRLSEPHYPTRKLPDDQSGFNPITIKWAFYDPDQKEIVGSLWDSEGHIILITSSLEYDKDEFGKVSNIHMNEPDRNDLVINDKKYSQQSGGYNEFKLVDGGVLSDDLYKTRESCGIFELLNIRTTTADKAYNLIRKPTNLNNTFVFLNGKLKFPDLDYKIINNQITLNEINVADQLFIFENISQSEDLGSINVLYQKKATIKLFQITVPDLKETDELFVFINGKLIKNNQIIKSDGLLKFNTPVLIGSRLTVLRINNSNLINDGIYLYYRGNAINDSTFYCYGIINRPILIFYDGMYMHESYDYVRNSNQITFRNFSLSYDKEIIVLGV